MLKCVAVVNDQTGDFAYILDGYQSKFPVRHPARMKKVTSVKGYGEWGEHELFKVETCDGLIHMLTTENYSFIYEEQEEE